MLIRQLVLRDVIPDSDDFDANCVHLWHQYASICISQLSVNLKVMNHVESRIFWIPGMTHQ